MRRITIIGAHNIPKVLSLVVLIYIIARNPQRISVESASLSQYSSLAKVLGEWSIYHEIGNFLNDAREKLETDCMTIIWDYSLSTVLDYFTICGEDPASYSKQPCIPVYTVRYEEDNITEEVTATLKASYNRQCGGYIIASESSRSVSELLHYGDDYRLINTRARFLIWYGITDKSFETDDIWKKVPNAILFHTKLGHRARRRMTFTIKGFKWPIQPNTADPTRVIDFWSQGKYFGRSLESWYREKTNDLRNVTLRILAVEHPPGVIKYVSPDGQIEYAGNEVDIVRELSHIMNFDYEFLEVESETKWGGQQLSTNNTPSFYGAVGRLIYGEADLAIGSFFVLKHYLDFLDMSIPLDVACTSFLTPNPLTRPRYLALILPFNYKLWALVLSICFIFAPVGLYALSKLPFHAAEFRVFTGRAQAVFTCFSIMSQVALHVWPRFWPVRMFIGWYWMFCLLITLAYRGAMVSFLTIPLFENPIDNINDLAASGLRIGGWGSELHRLFTQYASTTGEADTKTILKNRYQMIDDLNLAVSRVAEGEFALYENNRFLKFIKQTRNLSRLGSPTMRIMKQCVVPVHMGIAYQKNSPIVPTINRHIRRFQESGLMKRWSQRLVTKTKQHYRKLAEESLLASGDHHHDDTGNHEDDEEEEEENDEDTSGGSSSSKQRKQRVLNIRDLQGSLYLIFLGFFLSITAFIIEVFAAHSKGAAHNVNKELQKIKVKAKGKGNLMTTDGEAESAVVAGGSSSDKRKSKGGGGGDSQPGISSRPFLITSKNQLLANMLMEYEGVVRKREPQQSTHKKPPRKLGMTLRKSKPDSVRVKTNDDREVYFTYTQ